MNTIVLSGCTPEPLMNYLKALGVFRLVSEQADASARGCWRNGVFILITRLERQQVIDFFADSYRPTGIVSPWNGGGGFLTDSGTSFDTIDGLRRSSDERLQGLREIIGRVDSISLLSRFAADRQDAKSLDKNKKAKTITPAESDRLAELTKRIKETKNKIVFGLRNDVPDETLLWLDACLMTEAEGFAASPVLGSGGCDGNLEFSANFLWNVKQVLAASNNRAWLEKSLFAAGDARLVSASIGQFAPGQVGGPNATQGFEGQSLINPWDFILMIEGVVLLSGAVSRKLGMRSDPKAAFPFTVRASAAGQGSLSSDDGTAARGELWLPLWSGAPSFAELAAIFAEGRAELGGRQSRTGVEFARAVAGLGVDRGIESFTRQGFLKRSGLNYLATSLGRFDVRSRDAVDLLRQADGWLDRFRRACSDKTPARFSAALRRIESAIFDYCQNGGVKGFGAILQALGTAERELGTAESFRTDRTTGRTRVPPLAGLSPDWIAAANDGSPEFQLALALAGIFDSEVGPLRANLEPIDWTHGSYAWVERDQRIDRRVVWTATDLASNLAAVLRRRLMDARRLGVHQPPLAFRRAASLSSIAAFLAADCGQRLDEERLEELLWGLVLIDYRQQYPALSFAKKDAPLLPRAYGLLKLLFLPWPIEVSQGGSGPVGRIRLVRESNSGLHLTPDPEIVPLLMAGRVGEACQLAARRLRAFGFRPLPHRASGGGNRDGAWEEVAGTLNGRRLAAALLFPVSDRSVTTLLAMVTRPPEPQTESRARDA
jgi:CRISPR-associated protein Csx17